MLKLLLILFALWRYRGCVDAKITGWLVVIELFVIAICVVVFLCAVMNDGNGNRH